MWKCIFSLIVLSAHFLHAQEEEKVVVEILNVDTLPKYRIRSVEFNYNLMRFGENLLNKPRVSQEFQGELGVHKYFLVLDLGSEKTTREGYSMEGNYWRVGMDANLSAAWEDGNMIGLGLRYAKANFSDRASISRTLDDSSEIQIPLANENLSARWGELVFKIRGKVYKNLYTGYTMRYQFFKLVTPYPEELRPFDIPGYGKTKRPNSFQFDYYIGWRFSFD